MPDAETGQGPTLAAFAADLRFENIPGHVISRAEDLFVDWVGSALAGIRIGEFLGRSHYKIFHTTSTAGTIASAAASGRLLGLSPESMLNAFGSAATQAAGLWEFLRDAADSKPLHTGKAAANGLTATYLAKDRFTGARRVLEDAQGIGKGMSSDSVADKLVDSLGSRWALAETSFKFHASCHHTHPTADAPQKAMRDAKLAAKDVASVTARADQGAIDVLGPEVDPKTVHQAKFSMGTTLGLIAVHDRAGMAEFKKHHAAPAVKAFRDKVTMELDAEIDLAYPARWIGCVSVTTTDGRTVEARVDEPKGDPGNTLSRDEIEAKVHGPARVSAPQRNERRWTNCCRASGRSAGRMR